MQWMLAFSLGVSSLLVTPELFAFRDISLIAVVFFVLQNCLLFYCQQESNACTRAIGRLGISINKLLQCQLAFVLGLIIAQGHAESVMNANLPSALDGYDFEISGYISSNITNKKNRVDYQAKSASESEKPLSYQ